MFRVTVYRYSTTKKPIECQLAAVPRADDFIHIGPTVYRITAVIFNASDPNHIEVVVANKSQSFDGFVGD